MPLGPSWKTDAASMLKKKKRKSKRGGGNICRGASQDHAAAGNGGQIRDAFFGGLKGYLIWGLLNKFRRS